MTSIESADALFLGAEVVDEVYLGSTKVWPVTVSGVTYTINHDKVAADLTDFPVYLYLGDTPEGFWDLAGDGSGIRCYIGTTELACEVLPDWNELHVKVPFLSSTVDTAITVVPDGGARPISSSQVWSNNYVSVYHMTNDDPIVSIKDSASGYNAVPNGPGATPFFGIVGVSTMFDGATTAEVDPAGIISGANPRTMSAWIYTEVSGNVTIWGQGSADLGTLFEMTRYNDNLILHAYGGGYDTIAISAPIPNETPAYCCLTYDGTTVKVYLDGTLMGETPMELNTSTEFNNLGGPGYFGQWAGMIDDARLSSVERSAEWIATEYANQRDPISFYTVS